MPLRKRLIIADDYKPFVELCRDLLEPEFEVIDVAYNGLELLTKLSVRQPDAVLIDVFMPLMNGLYAAEQIKKKYPGIKMIFLTADPRPAIRAAALDRGASAVIVKGDSHELLTVLKRSLNEPSSSKPVLLDMDSTHPSQRFGQTEK